MQGQIQLFYEKVLDLNTICTIHFCNGPMAKLQYKKN